MLSVILKFLVRIMFTELVMYSSLRLVGLCNEHAYKNKVKDIENIFGKRRQFLLLHLFLNKKTIFLF